MLEVFADGFDLRLGGQLLLRHRADAPCLFVGRGTADFTMHRGHFDIEGHIEERVALRHVEIETIGDGWTLSFAAHSATPCLLEVRVASDGADAMLHLATLDSGLDRLWLRTVASPGEHLYGGGEQFSYLDLTGRRYPLWSSEPGVGRDKKTMLTWQADKRGGGGDYYTTNYPQPTWLSSRRHAVHIDTTAYAVFDFRNAAFHEVEVWAIPGRIELWTRPDLPALVTALSSRFGRQPPLPEWLLKGAVIGLKDGPASFDRLETYVEAGVQVAGLWNEDWVGLRETSFGSRLFWDWQWNAMRYPDLPARIAALAARGIRYLAYINPYLCTDGPLYAEAAAAGYLVMRPDADAVYNVDFGEFDAGHVDFTNPAAAAWFADTVICGNMIDFGISGWMADFGEYLPTDVRLASGMDGALAHNAWPVLWAEVNAKAIASRGKAGEAMFFMRSGHAGVQRHCPMLWAGDQTVDFSRHDGIGTVICAALSSGLLGNAYHHSDIGGYTSLFGTVRNPELLMRWAEMAAFTSMMRSHEGNRPRLNTQIDSDTEVLAHFARMTRIFAHLAPCLRRLSDAAVATGLPVQRPLFLHFEDDPRCFTVQTAFLYGPDLLVAPVLAAEVDRWPVYLPVGVDWVDVWTGTAHAGGQEVTVDAPLGQPPLFYRAGAADGSLFAAIAEIR